MFRHRRHRASAAPEIDLLVQDQPPPLAVSPDGEDHTEEWRALLELLDQDDS